MKHLLSILIFAQCLGVDAVQVQANENNRFLRIVLFLPEGTDAPEGYQAVLDSLAVRAEQFLDTWMHYWKKPIERHRIFARNDEGKVNVMVVHGQLKNARGRAALPEVRQKAIEGAMRQLELKADEPVIWWILYHYPDIRGFQGSSRKDGGGIAINRYPHGVGKIDPKAELSSPALVETSIKGTVHELGHALGLPHIGARPGLELGNSLMGTINRAYWARMGGKDPRVHLSEGASALLWKHPVFQKVPKTDLKMPEDFKVSELVATESANGQSLIVSGKLSASLKAHSMVAIDAEPNGSAGGRWSRSYVGAVDSATGTFKVVINEPFPAGVIALTACFENGVNTGDGKTSSFRGSSLQIQYSGPEGSREIRSN